MKSEFSILCEPEECLGYAAAIVMAIEALPQDEQPHHVVAEHIAEAVITSELTVLAAIDLFLRDMVMSRDLRPEYVAGARAVQQLISQAYGETLEQAKQRGKLSGCIFPEPGCLDDMH